MKLRGVVSLGIFSLIGASGCSDSAPGSDDPPAGSSTAAMRPHCLECGGRYQRKNFRFVEDSAGLPPDTSAEGTSTTDVDLVDVDGDGDLDLYITEGTAGPEGRPDRLYINDGTGGFSDETAVRLAAVNNTTNSTKTAFGDVDGDGDLDAVVANLGQEQLLLNDGVGYFSEAPPGALPITPFNPARGIFDVSADVVLVDVNGDGALDIAIANENPFLPGPNQGDQNRLYLNSGTGQFSPVPLPPALDQSVAHLPGDIDSDGDVDLIVLNRGQDRILLGDGSGGFVEETTTRIPPVDSTVPNASSARGGALADLDGDDDLDLIVGNSRGQSVEYYTNDGRGFFTPAPFAYTPSANDTITSLVVVDLDRDCDLDVYLANAGQFEGGPGGHGFFGAPDYYFENGGKSRFRDRTPNHFTPPADPTTVATFGDIDGDGDLDLVVGNTDDNVPGDTGGERIFIQRRPGER